MPRITKVEHICAICKKPARYIIRTMREDLDPPADGSRRTGIPGSPETEWACAEHVANIGLGWPGRRYPRKPAAKTGAMIREEINRG